MISTILVEDDLYIQKHFVDRLAADGEFHLVGVFRDAFEAEKHCDATVKLVLMDVQTQHKHSGLAAAERIKKAFPQIKIVAATSLVDPQVLQRAKAGAADSLWYKDHGTEELMSVVKRTLAGEKVFPDSSPAIEMEGTMSDKFSPRQLDILRLYIKGFTYQEIAHGNDFEGRINAKYPLTEQVKGYFAQKRQNYFEKTFFSLRYWHLCQ